MVPIPNIARWLAPVDALPLYCDGISQVVSVLLMREGIASTTCIGALTVRGAGDIPRHWWVRLEGPLAGWFIDFRARMWLGNAPVVPHGLHQPTAAHYYDERAIVGLASQSTYESLTGRPLADFPPLP